MSSHDDQSRSIDFYGVLRAHATSDGEVDLDALVGRGVPLASAALRDEIDRLRDLYLLRYQPRRPWPLERVVLTDRRGLPDPPPHPADWDDDTPGTISPC